MKSERENPLLNICLNVIIPSFIMMKLSDPKYLGPFWGLVVALAFPMGYGFFELYTKKKFNFFSILGLISVLLTGGIGLLKLSRNWMIAKEAGMPLLFGIAVIVSNYTHYPLVKTFLGEIIKLREVDEAFIQNGYPGLFYKKLEFSSKLLALSFLLSALLNYILAEAILVGEPGEVRFNESLGKMTALSFPVITIPMMFITGFILYDLCKAIKKFTRSEIDVFLKT